MKATVITTAAPTVPSLVIPMVDVPAYSVPALVVQVPTTISADVLTAINAQGTAQLVTMCAMVLDPCLKCSDYGSALYAAAQSTLMFSRSLKRWQNYVSGARSACDRLTALGKTENATVQSLTSYTSEQLTIGGYITDPEDVTNWSKSVQSIKGRAAAAKATKAAEAKAKADAAEAAKAKAKADADAAAAAAKADAAKAKADADAAAEQAVADPVGYAKQVAEQAAAAAAAAAEQAEQAAAQYQALLAEQTQPEPVTAAPAPAAPAAAPAPAAPAAPVFTLVEFSSDGTLTISEAATTRDLRELATALMAEASKMEEPAAAAAPAKTSKRNSKKPATA